MSAPVICLVTIHGIGFEQAPIDDLPNSGYADILHRRLSHALGTDLLADDPNRGREQDGDNGAIYVQSLWPPEAPTREQGLARLGHWDPPPARSVNTAGAPLLPEGGSQRFAHVALVYSHLEPIGPHIGSGTVATAMAAVSVGHYASVIGLARMAFNDIGALLSHQQPAPSVGRSSLQVRRDALPIHRSLHLPLLSHIEPEEPDPTGALAIVRNLENDVAVYVSRNDGRERVRGFVREALARLLCRDDVEGIVINSHSNGTVVAWDVLHDLPDYLTRKVRWLVTAGSPLRKYATLFNWGADAGNVRAVGGWTNFWDAKDPVADPLAPPGGWRLGDPVPVKPGADGLFRQLDPDTGSDRPMPVSDVLVDNLGHGSSSGLVAHDYWDNEAEFVSSFATILRGLL